MFSLAARLSKRTGDPKTPLDPPPESLALFWGFGSVGEENSFLSLLSVVNNNWVW